jgi:transposase
MNLQSNNVISDITGESGLRTIEAILAGERNPEQLAALCSTGIKASRQTVAKSLHGNWDEALLFCLKTALETYGFRENKIQDCDKCIERQLAIFEISLQTQLHQVMVRVVRAKLAGQPKPRITAAGKLVD